MLGSEKEITVEELNELTCDRYIFERKIGLGAYGIVFSAIDKETQEHVAIKVMPSPFLTLTDSIRILREIKILSNLKHDNIINLIDVVTKNDFDNFDRLVMVIDLMDTDLNKVVLSQIDLTTEFRQYFGYQLVRGLKYVHSANVYHRDLKPANIFVNETCDLKIADFGLAGVIGSKINQTLYVTTRYYRAPEILLEYDNYGSAVDMWSVGCILAELIMKVPIFPGKGTHDQLELITDILGSPTNEDIEELTNKNARNFITSLPQKKPTDLSLLLKGAEPEEIDLISRMLVWDPRKRISAAEALEHPFFADLHDPAEEPSALPFDHFEFDESTLSIDDVKKLLWEEICRYHPDFTPIPK